MQMACELAPEKTTIDLDTPATSQDVDTELECPCSLPCKGPHGEEF